MEEKRIYLVFFAQTESKGAILGVTFSSDTAFDIAQKFLHDNPTVNSCQLTVKCYDFTKEFTITDFEDLEEK